MLPANKPSWYTHKRLVVPYQRSPEWFWVKYTLYAWGLPRDLCKMIANKTHLHEFYRDREADALRSERIMLKLKFLSDYRNQINVRRILSCCRFSTHQLRVAEDSPDLYPRNFRMLIAEHSIGSPFASYCRHPGLWVRARKWFPKGSRIIWTGDQDAESESEKGLP